MKEIPNYPGYYADKMGVIYTKRRHGKSNPIFDLKILATYKHRGYKIVRFYKNGKQVKRRVHQIILETFVGPCPIDCIVRHKNDIPDDNRLENLEYGLHIQNIMDKKFNAKLKNKFLNYMYKNHSDILEIFINKSFELE